MQLMMYEKTCSYPPSVVKYLNKEDSKKILYIYGILRDSSYVKLFVKFRDGIIRKASPWGLFKNYVT